MKNHLKNKLMTLVTLINIIMILNNCKSGHMMTPIAITKLPTQVSLDRATLNGTVSAFNFMSTVSFEYGKTTSFGQSQNPPFNQFIGSTFSDVSVNLTGLTPGTTYYYRFKALFSGGTTYGNYEKFTTLDKAGSILFNSDLTYGSINDIDGNTYKTIQIGTQTWMAENLKTTKYNDGTAISLSENSWRLISPEPIYCWYNNNAAVYKDIYGLCRNISLYCRGWLLVVFEGGLHAGCFLSGHVL